MGKEKPTYNESLKRIETIVDIIENQSPGIDELADLVKEGTSLILECQNKLKNTEKILNESLEKLQ